MRRRAVTIEVSDHAVLRYLQRQHGIDIELVRKHLGGLVVNGAQLGAVAVQAEAVKLLLRERADDVSSGAVRVTVTTALERQWNAEE